MAAAQTTLPIDNDLTLAVVRSIAHSDAAPAWPRVSALAMLCEFSGLLDERTQPRTLTIVRYTRPFRPRPPEDEQRERELDEREAADARIVNDLKTIAVDEQHSPSVRLRACRLLGKIGGMFRKTQDAIRLKLIYRKPPPQPPQQGAEHDPDHAPTVAPAPK